MKTEKTLVETGPSNAILIDRELPNLHTMSPSRIDLSSNYWSPSTVGDSKLGIILGIENSQYLDEKTGEMINLRCIVFVEQLIDQSLIRWRNGGCRLLSTIENALSNGAIVAGVTAIKIEYLGKVKTKNGRFLDDFSVKILTDVSDDINDLKPPFSQT